MKRYEILLGVFLALLAPMSAQQQRIHFAIQPVGEVDPSLIMLAAQAIKDAFPGGSVITMARREMPAGAYYPPRMRYRAEKLIEFLDGLDRASSDKILGLTCVDISTTKGTYEDWGIFGMANISGPSCVVSTYRLGPGKVAPELFGERLKKVVIHELGHSLGLPHCSNPGCVMQDAEGRISTVDRGNGRFCADCTKRLGALTARNTDPARREEFFYSALRVGGKGLPLTSLSPSASSRSPAERRPAP